MLAPSACGERPPYYHRRYRSKAEAEYDASWHLSCWKCRAGGVLHVFPCPWGKGGHWHVGHARP